MPNALLFLEFLGTSELLMIAVVALLLFGPRKLPEISRTLGKSLAEFKRASDDFKRTWEYEVELEQRKPALDAAEEPRADVGETTEQSASATAAGASAWGATTSGVTAEELMNRAVRAQQESQTVARTSSGAEAGTSTGDGASESVVEGSLAEGSAASLNGGAAASIVEGSAVTDEQDQGDIELNAS